MPRRCEPRLSHALAGVIALLACLLAPSRSEAACGDHVRFAGDIAETGKDVPAKPTPCEGPSCSRRDSDESTAPAPGSENKHRGDDVACLDANRRDDDGTAARRANAGESDYDHATHLDIFHPPRSL